MAKIKKSKCDLKNRFYVAADSIFERNDDWAKPTLDKAVSHARRILDDNGHQDVKYIVKIIAKVERVQAPVQVSLFD